jgi:hypothetical protein
VERVTGIEPALSAWESESFADRWSSVPSHVVLHCGAAPVDPPCGGVRQRMIIWAALAIR